MAIYHFSAQVISRSQGRSSVAASAYRSAEKMTDERTGLTHDFTKKSDVLDKTILLPEHAPAWMHDRTKLWNAVETVEKRKDAQLAREINIALPRELSAAKNWQLLTAFVQREFVDRGMVADVAFHRGHKGGEEQPHGHVMLTLREVTPDGFGQKVRAWNERALLQDWRERWAEQCNLALATAGLDHRVDHRTLEAQGINLEPQSKIGPKAAERSMARFEEHQALARRNGERLLEDPSIALKAITYQQSTFTHQDLARFVNRHTVNADQFQAVYERVKTHPDLVFLGRDDRGRDRFTTQELLTLERCLIDQVQTKAKSSKHTLSAVAIEALDAVGTLSSEQCEALTHLTQGMDIACVVGFAGTGKSYMLGVAREAWEAAGYRVQGMTLAGIAAENLESGSGIRSTTVASRLWHWERDRERLTSKDIVVVDEAGMLGSRQMAGILREADNAGAKVVLVGDPEQLQAIEAGAPYRAIAERIGFVEMTEVRRQREPWQQQATRDLATQQTEAALRAYARHENVHVCNTTTGAIHGMVEQWDEARSQTPHSTQIMLAYTRAAVRQLNERAQALRQAQGELGESFTVATSRGERTFYDNDRIYFLRNENQQLHVKNGTLGTIEKVFHDEFIVRLDPAAGEREGRRVAFNLTTYNDIDHGYAATVYKAQGITVDRTHVLASRYFDRHSTYVALSRHREGADLYVSREEFPQLNQLTRIMGRERTKDVTLDYALASSLDVDEAQRLQDRAIPQPDTRLSQRDYDNKMQAAIAELQKKTSFEFSVESFDIKAGDRGIYRGYVSIYNERYGVLEQPQGPAKLIALDQLESREQDKAMEIEKRIDDRGEEMLRAFQPAVRERELDMDMEIGDL